MSALALVPPVEAGGLDPLLRSQRVWRAAAAPRPAAEVPCRPTGWAALDAVLPAGGWPEAALVEVLIAHDGIGELALLLPALAMLASRERPVLLVAPPYRPYAPAWQRAGIALAGLQVVDASPREAPWAMEQALRAGSCSAVLGWPLFVDDVHGCTSAAGGRTPGTADVHGCTSAAGGRTPGTADVHGCTSAAGGRMPGAADKALRRLQVAAEAGQCLGVAFRPVHAGANPSPAPLRLQVETENGFHVRVLKCRGTQPPARALRLHGRA